LRATTIGTFTMVLFVGFELMALVTVMPDVARLLHGERWYALSFASAMASSVVGMVATHDNPYLGYPLSGADRLALRDCDRVWVMHCVSFYKDWSSKREPDPNTNVRRLLAVRRVHFYGDAARGEADWGVDESVWGEAAGRTEIPALAAAQAKIGRLFERGRGELASGVWERGQSGPDSLGAFLLEVVSGE